MMKQIQIMVARVDIALVAVWHIIRIALPVMVVGVIAIKSVRYLGRRR